MPAYYYCQDLDCFLLDWTYKYIPTPELGRVHALVKWTRVAVLFDKKPRHVLKIFSPDSRKLPVYKEVWRLGSRGHVWRQAALEAPIPPYLLNLGFEVQK